MRKVEKEKIMSTLIQSRVFGKHLPLWTTLGKGIKAASPDEAIKEAGLDWKTTKVPMTTHQPNGSFHGIHIPRHDSIIRQDTGMVLGVMGKTYEVIDNKTPFEMIAEVADSKNVNIDYAGEFDEGRLVWIDTTLTKVIMIGPERLTLHIIVNWSHDGTYALTASFKFVHSDTGSTFSAKIPGFPNSMKIKHTKKCISRINEMVKIINQALGFSEHVEADLTKMVNKPWSITDMEE
jgi:hypothetical protein